MKGFCKRSPSLFGLLGGLMAYFIIFAQARLIAD
jgi:hypothetical protein